MPIVLLMLVGMLCLASPAGAVEGGALLQQVDANLQPESFESYRKLINIEPNGAQREFLLYTLKKGNDMIASLFLAPASETGRATLRLSDNMWLYIPNVGKPIRITSLQSVVGGVFNNADIMRLDYHVEYDVRQLEDLGTEYLLDLKAKTGAVAYDVLKMWVEKATVTPTKIECYAATGLLIKTLYFKERKPFDDGTLRPAVIETDSPLYKGYRSIIVYAKVQKRSLPDEVFTLDFLPRIGTMR
jgi:outer membrane lipoprotein-sorting protein